MKQFVTGFVVASIVWLGVLYAQSVGKLDLFGSDAEKQAIAVEAEPSAERPERRRRRSKRARRSNRGRRKRQAGKGYDTGEGVKGDFLGAPGSRELSMGGAGGEDQLSSSEIDRGIDRVFRGIERCLVLVPSEAPTTGKLIVGMHIASSGRVTKVNLKGANVMIRGEAGVCIRRNVKSIRYRSFDGPDMTVHYPIIFD